MFFLTQMWTVLVPLLACSLLIFLSFDIVMVARHLCLWDFTVYLWLCFSGQGLLDILMIITNFSSDIKHLQVKNSGTVGPEVKVSMMI